MFLECGAADCINVAVNIKSCRREVFQRDGANATRNFNLVVCGVVSGDEVVKAVCFERITFAEAEDNVVAAVVDKCVTTCATPERIVTCAAFERGAVVVRVKFDPLFVGFIDMDLG